MPRPRTLAYLALTANAIIWGAAFPIIKPAFEYLNAAQYLYLRFLVAGICALPLFLNYYLKSRPKLAYLIKVLFIETAGTVIPLLILYHGLATTSALEASLIGATGPIFVVLGGIIFLREKESKREWQGLILSLIGSFLIIAEPAWNGHGFIGSTLSGNMLVLFYNLLYAVYAVIAKKVYKKKPPLFVGSLTYLIAAGIYGWLLSSQSLLPNLSLLVTNPAVSIAVFYMALPGTILAFIFYLYAQSKIEVSEANLFTYLNGVVAIPAAYFLLGESPSFTSLLAILIISFGIYLANFRPRKSSNKRRRLL